MSTQQQQEARLHIRWMIRRDMAEVLEIENQSFEFPWSEEEFIRCLRQRNCIGMVADCDDKVVGFVTFGGERVIEEAELKSFYSPGGGLEFFTDGHSPVSLEILSKGLYVNLGGAGGFGPEAKVTVPLVPSVPGAPFASVKSILGKFGSAYKSHGKTIYYGRVPKTCPKGGFPLKTEVIFAENGEESKPETVDAEYKAPCPRK